MKFLTFSKKKQFIEYCTIELYLCWFQSTVGHIYKLIFKKHCCIYSVLCFVCPVFTCCVVVCVYVYTCDNCPCFVSLIYTKQLFSQLTLPDFNQLQRTTSSSAISERTLEECWTTLQRVSWLLFNRVEYSSIGVIWFCFRSVFFVFVSLRLCLCVTH